MKKKKKKNRLNMSERHNKSYRRHGDSERDRDNRPGNRSLSYQGSSSADWHKRNQRNSSHRPYHHNRANYTWRNQQSYQREQALQVLQFIGKYSRNQGNVPYRNAPFSTFNIFNNNSSITSSKTTFNEIPPNRAVDLNNKQQDVSKQDEVRNEPKQQQNDKTEDVNKNTTDANKSSIENDIVNSVPIKTEVEFVNKTDESNVTSNTKIQNESEVNLSILPLNLLIKNEPNDLVLETHFRELKDQFEKSLTNNQLSPPAEPIQFTSQTQDPEQLSQKLVNRVITMDRVSIKEVINNPETKFDAALKLQARKRFREEARKQLRQINLNTSQGKNEQDFEPDQFVDCEQLPDDVINEIRKSLGIQFLEEAGIPSRIDCQNNNQVQENDILPDVVEEAENIENAVRNKNRESEKNFENSKPDLMTRLKNFEIFKSQRNKNMQKSRVQHKVQQQSSKSSITAEIVAINSSSDSSDDSKSSDTESSDSSSSSSSSYSSIDSSEKNKKKKKALEESVVNSFKSLIFPQLTNLQQQRFEKKSSNGILESLTYIYDICLNKIGKKICLGNYEKTILKKNLKSSNNDEALQFLIKNIKELFEDNKKKRRDATKNTNNRKNASKAKKQPSKPVENNKKNPPEKLSEENQQILFNAANEIPGMKPSNDDNHPSDQNNSTAHPQQEEYINKEKVPTESKNAQSAVGEAYSQPPSSSSSSTPSSSSPPIEGNNSNHSAVGIGSDCNKISGSILNSLNSLCVEKTICSQLNDNDNSDIFCNDDTSNLSKYLNFTNVEKTPTSFKNNNNNYNTPISIGSDSPESTQNEFKPRSWKSPGEKKCLQPLLKGITSCSIQKDNKTELEHEISNVQNQSSKFLSDMESINISNTFNINQSENLRILSLMQQNKISETVLNSLKEIDLKLLVLHKRKMNVEEMILKFQKDKMAIDLSTMQLQNERFLIISSAAAQTNLTVPSTCFLFPETVQNVETPTSRGKNKKKNPNQSRPLFSTPFSEKLRNRKKRCQRDILLEHTANTLCNDDAALTKLIRQSSPEEISENVDDIFQRKKRKVTKKISLGDDSKGENCCSLKSPRKETSSVQNKKLIQKNCISRDNKTNQKCSSESIDETLHGNVRNNQSALLELNVDHKNESLDNVNNNDDIPNGIFQGFKMPISQICITGEFIIAASEDGLVYKFNWKTKELLSKFTKHTETVTQILIDEDKYVYTTSLDGYMKKTSVENFGLEIQSVNMHEPLQTIELNWNIAFIGSRWGNVFTYNVKKNKLADILLCSLGSSIMALKATTEGARRILIVSSKGNQINLRDVTSGLLLRTIEVPLNVNIYSVLLHESLLYCGSSKNEIFTYDFTTGSRKSVFLCGNGVVSIRLFRRKYIFAGCYDGFVYVLDKITGFQIGRFPGCGKIILAMDIIGEKLLTSSKDNSMELVDIPKYILALEK